VKQPAPDVVIAGKYCLESQLASGGMGSVWIARHLDLDIEIAIKFMDPACASPEGRVRFEREAKAAACLQSPHVVAVLDYGVDEDLPYIVMELLKGEDLEDRLLKHGRLPLAQASKILSQAAKALRRAQELGIVHRDLKPHNLFLAKAAEGDEEHDDVLKILDFGIAKETGPALVGGATQTGEIMGSPHYMSPEHVRGARDIDFRSDLWSLGVIMFRACTGRLPFDSDVVGDVIGKILADPIPKATSIAKDLPASIDEFFGRALARDRNQRYQSAREMADEFAEIVRSPSNPRISRPPSLNPMSGRSGAKSSTSLNPFSDAGGGDSNVTQATTVDTRRAQSGNPAVLKGIAAGAAVVIAAGVMVILLARGPSTEEVAQPSGAAAAAPPTPSAVPENKATAPAPTAPEPPASPSAASAASTASTAAAANTSTAPADTSAAPADTTAGTQKATTAKPATTGAAKPATTNKPPKKSWGF